MACPSCESCTVASVRSRPSDGKSITDVGKDCLGYHMRYNFIEYILFQREVLDLIRLVLALETAST